MSVHKCRWNCGGTDCTAKDWTSSTSTLDWINDLPPKERAIELIKLQPYF